MSNAEEKPQVETVTAEQLVARMLNLNPNIQGHLPDKRMQTLAVTAMRALARELDSKSEGSVRVAGLGRFNIRQSESAEDKRFVLRTLSKKVED